MLLTGRLGAARDVGKPFVNNSIDEIGALSKVCKFCRFETKLLMPFCELLSGTTVLGEFVGADILAGGRTFEVSGARRLPITEGRFKLEARERGFAAVDSEAVPEPLTETEPDRTPV